MAKRTRATAVFTLAALVAISGLACPPAAEAPAPAAAPTAAASAPPPPPRAADAGLVPAAAPQGAFDGAGIDRAVEVALAENKMPGCVVVVGTHDRILLRKAYGSRAVDPEREPMDVDTIFDLASLTKPIATAASLYALEEQGKISLDDRVSKWIPVFGGRGKDAITIRQLMLHVSGLPAVSPRSDYTRGIAEAMNRIGAISPSAPPGARFRYSDVGYVVLGEIVARASGKSLDAFAKEAVFEPIGMKTTTFLPPAAWRPRIAPTERRDGVMLRGEVHDPISAMLGGVAGNAGLFSTGDDLARFAQTILGKGAIGGKRVFAEATLHKMLAVHDVPNGLRALGWDVRSSLSQNRAEALSRRAVGHGGYTGTALWIDPARDLFVVFLSNRVHPDGKGAVQPLVAKISGVAIEAADALAGRPAPVDDCDPTLKTTVGIDVLEAEKFRRLDGKRVALLSNGSARAADGRTTFRVLKDALAERLTLLFVPEHGFGADSEGRIEDGALDGVPVKSLYGARLSPDDAALSTFDVLVVDLPDVGARFFTYGSTLHRVLKAASAKNLPVVVLDRPNPYGGTMVDGPAEVAPGSFVQHHPLPLLHGLTLGELAYLLDADEHLGTDLDVVPVHGWKRGAPFDQTGLTWTPPSPNLKTFASALAYAATALVEGTNVSVGRGTAEPFSIVGAPWLNADAVATSLNTMALGGVSFEATTAAPSAGPFAGATIPAVRLKIVDRGAYRPVRVGFGIAVALHAVHPNDWDTKKLGDMIGAKMADDVRAGMTVPLLEGAYRPDVVAFSAKRAKHVMYRECIAPPPATPPTTVAAATSVR